MAGLKIQKLMVTQTVGLIGLDTCTLAAAGFLANFSFGLSFTCLIGREFNPKVLMTLQRGKGLQWLNLSLLF